MHGLTVLLFLSGLALVLGAAMAKGGLAQFTEQATVTGNTFTTAACFPSDTGFLNATSDVADTGGDGDGFEVAPTNAYVDDGGNASNFNGRLDRHRYYDYGISIPSDCSVKGFEVRLDWWMDSISGANNIDVKLSWDGGSTWTALKTDSEEHSSDQTNAHYDSNHVLGGSTDTWGRSWTISETSDANFRIRLATISDDATRDFFLDWVPVKVYYGP